MKIYEAKERSTILIEQLTDIWEDSVKSTHLFLLNEEIENIKKYVPQALTEAQHLIILENEDNLPIAFIGVENTKIEMLFIKNNERNKGYGKQLLNYCIKNYNANEVTVNEQNPNAKGFYEHFGFKVYKRTELDEQRNQFPILYMRLEK